MATNEGARKTPEALVVSDSPDVCLTPVGSSMVPVPYPITASFSDSILTTSTVWMTSDPVFNVPSAIQGVTGDEAGTGNGVATGTHSGAGYCRVVEQQHTLVVKAEGHLVVYHNSKMWMNCSSPTGPGNTIGSVVYMSSTTYVSVDEEGAVSGETNPEVSPETAEELKTETTTNAGAEFSDEMKPGSDTWEADDSISVGVEDKTTHFNESLGDYGNENLNAQLGGAEVTSTTGYSVDSTGTHTATVGGNAEVYVARAHGEGEALGGLVDGSFDATVGSLEAAGTAQIQVGPDKVAGELDASLRAVAAEIEGEGNINITGKTVAEGLVNSWNWAWGNDETYTAPDWADHGLVVTLGGGVGAGAVLEGNAKAGIDLAGDEQGRIVYAELELGAGLGFFGTLKAGLGLK